MKQGKLFTKTRREIPSDESFLSAQLLIRAGFIHKELSGVYSLLPLGKRVMDNLQNIVDLEMKELGSNEVHMSALQDPEIWKKTNRWADENVDVWFKTKLKNETEIGLAITHEEPITRMLKDHINSYKDLPVFVHQFQTKFRNELRAKSGMMRGREFLMKDMYSFCIDPETQADFYEKAKESYIRIFNKLGIGDKTFLTKASGGSFSEFSDEFQTVCDAGEDLIYLDQEKNLAINKEIYNDEIISKLDLNKESLKELKTVEVGNIFNLGNKFSESLELKVNDENGKPVNLFMGSYGIGISRLMGVIAENLSDEKGLNWPESVAPFKVHIISIGDNQDVLNAGEDLYKKLSEKNIDVLFDDRDISAGQKFGDADLIGIPHRIIISNKTLENNKIGYLNYFKRSSEELLEESEVLSKLIKIN